MQNIESRMTEIRRRGDLYDEVREALYQSDLCCRLSRDDHPVVWLRDTHLPRATQPDDGNIDVGVTLLDGLWLLVFIIQEW